MPVTRPEPESEEPSDRVGSRLPRRVSSATLMLLASRGVGTLGGLVAWTILARVLSPADFGRYTFYLALALALDALADLGTSSAALARSAGDPERLTTLLPSVRRVRIGTSLACVAVWTGVVLIFEDETHGWLLVAGLHPLGRVLEASSLAFQDAIRWRVPALLRAATALLRLVLVLLLAAAGVRTFAPYLLVHAGLAVASNIAHHVCARPRLARSATRARTTEPAPHQHGVRALGWRQLFHAAWPLGLAALAQATYFHVDNLFVRRLCGTEEVGVYNAAVRLFGLAVLVPTLLTQVALPWLAAGHRAGTLADGAGRLLGPLILYGSIVALGLGWFADPLLSLIFGERFAASSTSLVWLAASVVVIAAGAVLLTTLIALGNSRDVLRIALAGVIVNAIGNAWLVPSRGIEGAALATLATETWIAWAAWRRLLAAGIRPRVSPRSLLLASAAFSILVALGTHSWVS